MNPADNPENWVSLPSSNPEERMVSDNTIDCPFYSVVPTSNSERGESEEGEAPSQQIYQLPPGESSPEVVETKTEFVDEQVEPKIDIEAILDSELDKVVTWELGMEETATEEQNPIADSYSIPIPESHQEYNPETNIEDPEQVEIGTEFAQLLELNQELRTANDELYTHVEALKEALKDSEAALQRHKKRADVTESLLAQQNQELAAAQSQIASLFQQLETSQQNLQHQEALLETYRAHLETNQQKLAQLERECANLHANFQEKSQQLAHSEATCRELRTRLMRQQRQTLQFKAALEKCLEAPLPDNGVSNHENIHSLLNRTQPIQPWSGETEEGDNSIYPSIPKPSAAVPPWQPPTPSEKTQRQSEEDQTSLGDSVANTTSSTDETAREENPWEDTCDSPATDPSIFSESLTSLEAQIDSVIQMFFTAQTANFSNSATEQPQNLSPEPETSTSHLELDTPSPWDTPVNSPSTPNDINTITIDAHGNITDGIGQNHQQPVSHPATTKADTDNTHVTQTEDIWGDISNLTPEQISILQSPAISDIDDRNSPSPLVYPRRPPKGRKSLSSVELPNFRPHQK
ncbi:hypothetical protein [Calothrix sp. NIES-3974]|uniref:hypothetical protein n=1 Tax=Calothrix sp. NIES-3974 TaxID=2005462 RepID=UPI000BBC8A0D|nr:hypothetical protein [Calothrix sp. NIES-3974]